MFDPRLLKKIDSQMRKTTGARLVRKVWHVMLQQPPAKNMQCGLVKVQQKSPLLKLQQSAVAAPIDINQVCCLVKYGTNMLSRPLHSCMKIGWKRMRSRS